MSPCDDRMFDTSPGTPVYGLALAQRQHAMPKPGDATSDEGPQESVAEPSSFRKRSLDIMQNFVEKCFLNACDEPWIEHRGVWLVYQLTPWDPDCDHLIDF